MGSDTVAWPTASKFQVTQAVAKDSGSGYWYEARDFSQAEHSGTHGYKEYKDVLIRNPITQTPNSKLLLVIRQFIRHFYWILKGASMRHKAWS